MSRKTIGGRRCCILKEMSIEEAIEALEKCDYLVEPIIVRREDKKALVFIDINEYNNML